MNLSIDPTRIKQFYERHRSDYLQKRGSSDPSVWDESYKWSLLSKLTNQLNSFNEVASNNINEILDVYLNSNPQYGTLIDWREVEDLKTLVSKPNGWQVFKELGG